MQLHIDILSLPQDPYNSGDKNTISLIHFSSNPAGFIKNIVIWRSNQSKLILKTREHCQNQSNLAKESFEPESLLEFLFSSRIFWSPVTQIFLCRPMNLMEKKRMQTNQNLKNGCRWLLELWIWIVSFVCFWNYGLEVLFK